MRERSPRIALAAAMVTLLSAWPAGAWNEQTNWVKRFGGSGSANDMAVALDLSPDGSGVWTGSTSATSIDLGQGPLTGGANDLLVGAFAADGSPLWGRRIGGAGTETPGAIAIDSASSHIVVAGSSSSSTIDFGSGPLNGPPPAEPGDLAATDVVVAKYGPTGTLLWARRFGGAGIDYGTAIATLPDEGVVVAGVTRSGTFSAGGPTLAGDPDAGDLFLVTLNADGTHRWSRRFAGCRFNTESVPALAAGADGTIVLAGRTRCGSFDLGGGPLTGQAVSGTNDVASPVIAAYDIEGTHRWSRRIAGNGYGYAENVAVAPDGSVAVVGAFTGQLDLGSGPVVARALDAFLIRFHPSGSTAWAHTFGDRDTDILSAVAISDDGSISIGGGSNSSTISLGGDPLPRGSSSTTAIVATYSEAGIHLRSRRMRSGVSNITSIGISAGASLLYAGAATDEIDAGGGPTPGFGGTDVLLGRYSTDFISPAAIASFGRLPLLASPLPATPLTGSATDADSGVAAVEVAFTHSLLGTSQVATATTSCSTADRRTCTFSIDPPTTPGQYAVRISPIDRAGNRTADAATGTVLVA